MKAQPANSKAAVARQRNCLICCVGIPIPKKCQPGGLLRLAIEMLMTKKSLFATQDYSEQ
jgi:hypothetical protein